MTDNQRDTRREYEHKELRRADLQADPLQQFKLWMEAALAAELTDATAMALATADATGRPANRIVLLKHFDERGFAWYTDYRSHKGRDLAVNPQASLLFYWRELERQVRIDGVVERLSREESEGYFSSRPPESRFSAAVSHQSAPVDSRADLQAAVDLLRQQYPQGDVPPPLEWGGYSLLPDAYEFWQGREGRLHDRFRYRRQDDDWVIERLQP